MTCTMTKTQYATLKEGDCGLCDGHGSYSIPCDFEGPYQVKCPDCNGTGRD